MTERNYLNRLAGVISRFFNVLLLNGHPAESISGRCWRMRLQNPDSRWWWRLCRFVDTLFFWELDHCMAAYIDDIRYSEYRLEQHDLLFNKTK